jgi:hypothetical protein
MDSANLMDLSPIRELCIKSMAERASCFDLKSTVPVPKLHPDSRSIRSETIFQARQKWSRSSSSLVEYGMLRTFTDLTLGLRELYAVKGFSVSKEALDFKIADFFFRMPDSCFLLTASARISLRGASSSSSSILVEPGNPRSFILSTKSL